MRNSTDLRLRLYVTIVSTLGAIAFALTVWLRPPTWTPLVLALMLVAMLSDVLTVQLPSVSVSITYSVCTAAIILLGPTAGGLTSGLATIPAAFTVKDRRLLRGVFNFSQLTITGLASGWVYTATGGPLLFRSPLTAGQIPLVAFPVALLAVTSFLLNTAMVGLFVAIRTATPFLVVWRSSFAWTIPTQAALTVLALALAQVVASEGVVGLALFVVPLMIARQFYERYMALRRAYADTVRSLVAVIEAKDAYTRGHSERVAAYSIDTARRLGFSDQRIERLELAALLHDLGKVGISKSILLKKSRLDDEEYEAIKSHPDIGAHIIESVPFLADLVPFISSHHEHVDGSGYGNHLAGEQIPLEARVLSVADAFDAMTSSRPYREAMSRENTVRELRRCAGQQFDQVIVETFAEALANGAFPEDASMAEAADEPV